MDAKVVAEGIWDGLKGIPRTAYFGARRSYITAGLVGSERRVRNEREDQRFFQVIKSALNNDEPLRRLITKVLTDYYQKLDEEARQSIQKALTHGGSSFAAHTVGMFATVHIISQSLIRNVKLGYTCKKFFKYGTALSLNMLMVEGTLEEAALASRRLYNHYSRTYWQVQPQGLDMLYFLVEDQLRPYLEYTYGPPNFCKRVDDEICKKYR